MGRSAVRENHYCHEKEGFQKRHPFIVAIVGTFVFGITIVVLYLAMTLHVPAYDESHPRPIAIYVE